MAAPDPEWIAPIAATAQVISVVIGVVLSIRTYNAGQEKAAEARKMETMKPFFELRQKLYLEAVQAAAVLSSPEMHTEEELAKAKKRFRQLYVSELSMVESGAVESRMRALGAFVDPELMEMTPAQQAAYNLSHGLRDSFSDWSTTTRKP